MMKTKTKKSKTIQNKNKKIENENENAKALNTKVLAYGAYGCYGHTALNLWLTLDSIQADHQHVFVSRFDIL